MVMGEKHIYADVILTATHKNHLYGKLEAFGGKGGIVKLGPTGGKISIITRSLSREIREIKKTLPRRYRGVKFAKETKLLGQKVDLGGMG